MRLAETEDRPNAPLGAPSAPTRHAGADATARSLLARLWPGAGEPCPQARRFREHAAALRAALLDDPKVAPMLIGRLDADAPDPILLAIRRFTLGWVEDERASAIAGRDEAAFAAALDGLLAGLSPAGEPARRLHRRLWALLSVARESADIVYSHVAGLPELDRRILLLLHGDDTRVAKDVTRLMGVDKAQVSRSVKRLIASDLIERDTIRRPLALTGEGRALTARLRRMFEVRSREVALGIDPAALADFFTALDGLDRNAILLFEEERGLASSSDRNRDGPMAGVLASEAQPRQPETIVTRLITLSTYMQRSAALAYKRLTGLSNFEARVLTEIAQQPPVDWSQLTTALARDESQAARTVRRLLERELVERQGMPGRREGSLRPTAQGERVFGILDAEAQRRDLLLMHEIAPDVLKTFLAVLDRMTWNVQAQLVRDLAARASDAARADKA